MGTGFQRDVERTASCCTARFLQGIDFRMSATELLVPAGGNQLLVLYQYTADQRIGFHVPLAIASQFQCTMHPLLILFTRSHERGASRVGLVNPCQVPRGRVYPVLVDPARQAVED